MLQDYNNIVYNYKGDVSCYCPKTNKKREMAYGGFEKDRKALKYKCPAKAYGYECKGKEKCPVNARIRIPPFSGQKNIYFRSKIKLQVENLVQKENSSGKSKQSVRSIFWI